MKDSLNKEFLKATKKVGWASFFLNCSSLIVFSYFAVYLKTELKISFTQLGVLDGFVDFLSYIMRFLSGFMSDVIINRKIFFLVGISLVVLAKPFEAILRSFFPMFLTKVAERIGNGIQATPRDALITDYTDEVKESERALAFGIRQSYGSAGSLAGSVLACLLLWYFGDYQTVFWCSVPFGLAAVAIAMFGVKNKYTKQMRKELISKMKYSIHGKALSDVRKVNKNAKRFDWRDIKKFPKAYWVLLGVTAVYFIAKISDSMALLYAIKGRNIPQYFVPLFFVCFHCGAITASYGSALLKRYVKKTESLFLAGISCFLVALTAMLFLKQNLLCVLASMGLLGAYSGLANGLFPACVSNLLPEGLKGTGHGVYNVTSACALLIGGTIIGVVSDAHGQTTAMCFSLILATISALFLLIYRNKK